MKNYITPDMEITEFDVEDVITTSGPVETPGNQETGDDPLAG